VPPPFPPPPFPPPPCRPRARRPCARRSRSRRPCARRNRDDGGTREGRPAEAGLRGRRRTEAASRRQTTSREADRASEAGGDDSQFTKSRRHHPDCANRADSDRGSGPAEARRAKRGPAEARRAKRGPAEARCARGPADTRCPSAAPPKPAAPSAAQPTPAAPSAAEAAAKPAAKPAPLPPLARADEVAAVVAADHMDPFGFLGMHALTDDAVVVRVFLPRATAVAVVDGETGRIACTLERVHEAGLFVGAIRGRSAPFAYRLRVDSGDRQVEQEDPYRFPTIIGQVDEHLLGEGKHLRSFDVLGARVMQVAGVSGVAFAVWAPDAARVAVLGDFNGWDGRCHGMRRHHASGLWDIFLPGVAAGGPYKYEIKTAPGAQPLERPDPCAFQAERWPGTASLVATKGVFRWTDAEWVRQRAVRAGLDRPMSIYEIHLGSWRRVPEEDSRWLTYRELAETLPAYVADMGFTHVELMPVAEYDHDGSWGYAPHAPYAPTGRFGGPDDLRLLIDRLHAVGVGVILDWVPTQFADAPGSFGNFDGKPLYEHPDPRQQRHARSQLYIYDYGRPQVANYLIANALYWIDQFHIDGLRIGNLAPILYLDYDRGPGEWTHNRFGGHENLEAIDFLRRFNDIVHTEYPGVVTIADEMSEWPMVSRPTLLGGLGFTYKWNHRLLGDIFRYFGRQPIHRKYYHDELTHAPSYVFAEHHVTPLSHDLIVQGRGPLISRMPGSWWDRFAHLRLLYAYLFAQPGKKLMFMGDELAQWREWNHDMSLDWHHQDDAMHRGVQNLVRDLNALYTSESALHRLDCDAAGFEWIDANDTDQSVLSFLRFDREGGRMAAVVCNFTPVVRRGYRVGVPAGGRWIEALNTDAESYGGSNVGNDGGVDAWEEGMHGRPFSLSLTLPPYSAVVMVGSASPPA
jgi:1,4-alpha-glucan branching enzyme